MTMTSKNYEDETSVKIPFISWGHLRKKPLH